MFRRHAPDLWKVAVLTHVRAASMGKFSLSVDALSEIPPSVSATDP